MAININAKTTGVGGLETSADNSGNINIQSGGSTVMSVTSSGVAVTGSFSQNGAVYSTQPSFRNLIINGDMQIAQRGTSVAGISSSNGYQTVDRFFIRLNGAGTYTVSQDADAPSGFSNSIKWACTTADAPPAAGDFANMQHRIEAQNLQHLAFGTSSAKQVTVSFWVKSSETGTAVSRLINTPAGKAVSFAYTINSANTWEKKTITFPADTVNTIANNNNLGFILVWYLSVGTDRTSGTLQNTWQPSNVTADEAAGQTINIAATTSSYINITGVQLEAGSTATDFENLPYDVQLQRCQRYYFKGDIAGQGTTDTAYNREGMVLTLPIWMRIAPSIEAYTWIKYGHTSGSNTSNPANDAVQTRHNSVTLYWNNSSAAYRALGYYGAATLNLGAEL